MRRVASPVRVLVLVLAGGLAPSAACGDDGPGDGSSSAAATEDGTTPGPDAGTVGPGTDGPASDGATDSDPPSPDPDAGSTSGGTEDDGTTTTSDDSTGQPGCSIEEIIDETQWDELFLHEDDAACFGSAYTFQGLVDAAADYPTFACEGDEATRRRELAAFLAQVSHETTGGWAAAPDGPYAWGLCFIEEVGCQGNACPQYCDPGNAQYPCAPGKTYHGRGAIQLSWNYNYGQAGDALGVDLLSDPDLVALDSKLAIQTALWFWMTEQLPKPSAHDVMVGHWVPSAMDEALGRLPGFGMTTNIINGGLECNMPTPPAVVDRVGFFERYAGLLSTDTGANVYCDAMASY